MAQKIELEVSPPNLKVSRGENAESNITLHNRGQTVDQFTIGIEGISQEWFNLPVSSVALFPNDQDKLKIKIHLPDDSDIRETSYNVKIKVTSQENPADFTTAFLTLDVGALPTLSLDLSPSQISGRKGKYQLSLTNPGDKEAKIQLKPSSSQRRIKLKAQPESLTVAPGKKTDAVIDARLSWWVIFLHEKTYDFQVSAEPFDGVYKIPVSGKAQITSVPWYSIFSKIRLPFLSRTPVIKTFTVTTDDKREFHFKWQVQRAKNVQFDGEDVEIRGEMIVHPTEPKQYALTAANRNGTQSQTREVNPLPLPKAKTSDNIKITLSASQVQVQAGVIPAMLCAQIQNNSDIVDKFLVEVEGLDDSWYNRSASSLALMPKATDQVQINFHPPRKKGVRAGIYQFALTVRSQSTAQESASILGQLEILPSVEVKTKINPYRISARRKGSFRVSLTNTSVSEANIGLEATDLDEGCHFKFLHEKIAVRAWNSIEVPMIVRPKRGSIIGEIKRYDITVTSTVEGSAMPLTANCELTHRPLLKDWKPIWRTIKAIISIAIVVIAVYYLLKMGGGWSTLRESPRDWLKHFVDTITGWFPQ